MFLELQWFGSMDTALENLFRAWPPSAEDPIYVLHTPPHTQMLKLLIVSH